MTVRLGDAVTFAQIGVVGLDGQIELEALRLYEPAEAAPALLCGTPALLFVVETTFEKRTVTIAVIAAEQAATSSRLVASGAEAAEGSIDPDRAKALARHTVVAWEGVGDRHGVPAEWC
jgi:hypothetical protein